MRAVKTVCPDSRRIRHINPEGSCGRLEEVGELPLRPIFDVLGQVMRSRCAEKLAISLLEIYQGLRDAEYPSLEATRGAGKTSLTAHSY